MKFLSFKKFIKNKEADEEELNSMLEQLAEEGIHDLHHNILFSNEVRGLRLDKLNEADSIDPALRRKLNDELTAIFAVFLPCVKFLGPNRMVDMINVINQKLTKPSKEILKDASGNPLKDANGKNISAFDYNRTKNRNYNTASDAEKQDIDADYYTLQVSTYALCVRKALAKDPTGLDRSKIKFEIKNKKIIYEINEGFKDGIAKFFKGIKKFIVDCLKAIFGKPQNGKDADEEKAKNMFSDEARNCKPNASDDEKKQCGVTWVKEVTMADIKIMNFNKASDKFGRDKNNDVINQDVDTNLVKSGDKAKYEKSFLKSIVLLSLKYGPGCLNYLMDGARKAIEQENKANANKSNTKP